MSEQENLGIVKDAYAAFAKGDIPGFLKLLDPAIEWEHPTCADIPYGGSRRGHKGVTDFFVTLGGGTEMEAFEARDFVAQGDRVIVLGLEKGKVRSTGRRYESPWAHAFTLKEGKITRFREYSDTAAIAGAYRKG